MNNTIIIVGHVGQAPKVVSFGDTGNKVVKFSVAVKEYSANSDEDKTIWLDVDAWNGLGERVLKLVTKGREVVVQGRLALSTFNKEVDGINVQMTKPVIKLTSFQVCGKRPEASSEENTAEAPRKKSKAAKG
ncbi:MAG: single-stranded DNA-binding protein [Candidatus Obscuribacterales bacterium]|nr:single-stranded DNA-binding protein [Candidatus Obscuribacterales bacterium]